MSTASSCPRRILLGDVAQESLNHRWRGIEAPTSLPESQAQSRCTVPNRSGMPELEQGTIGGRVPKCGARLEQMEKMLNVNITIP